MSPPALFFFFKIVLAIRDPLRIHMNFRMSFSIFIKIFPQNFKVNYHMIKCAIALCLKVVHNFKIFYC